MSDVPQQLPAPDPGEWNLIGTITPPPATGQMRLDNAVQTSATKLWFHKTNAIGADASAMLAYVKKGMEVTIANKSDGTKWQTYQVSASPVDAGAHVEIPVVWKRGGGAALPAQRTLATVTLVVTEVPVTGNLMVMGTKAPDLSISANVAVDGMAVHSHASRVEITGQLMVFDYAFPFIGPHRTSPGLSKREWYAGQALQGFIAKGIAHNLIGTVASYCFRVADSMIAEEARLNAAPTIPLVAKAVNPQPSTAAIETTAMRRASK